MKIKFLGSGSAFTLNDNNWQSNILIEKNDKRLLLDCGTDIRFSLNDAGLKILDIDDVYISHLHADHCGGLEYTAFYTFFSGKKINLHISKSMADELWRSTLSGGLSSIEGKILTLNDYFNVDSIDVNKSFTWQGIDFTLVQVIHIMNGFTIVPSFGLMFEENGTKVFWTSDTQFAPNQITKFYNSADVIFQDCETAPYKSGVHAHYEDLSGLPRKIKKKMWLYHYQPGSKPDAVKNGFQGFISKGQEFDI